MGRLESHKRVDLAIAAAQAAQVSVARHRRRPLSATKIARTAPPNVQVLGWLPEQELIAQVAGCRALLFPGEEDFGIVMVEALSAGKPVIAYDAGGATEIVQPGVNGVLVPEQTTDDFAQALRAFDGRQFSPEVCRETAAQFDEAVFTHQFKAFVEQKWIEFAQTLPGNS